MKLNQMALAAALSLFVFVGQAFADETSARVISFDPMTKIIILEDGNAYILDNSVDASGVSAGKTVSVTYTNDNGRRIISAIQAK
jgi:hypothetical protein